MSQQPNDLIVADYYSGGDAGTARFIRLIALWAIISGGAGTLQMFSILSLLMLRPELLAATGWGMSILHWVVLWPGALLMLLGGLACWHLRPVGRILIITAAILAMLMGLFNVGTTLYTYLVRMPSFPSWYRIIYPIGSFTGYLGSLAFPIVVFVFFNRADVKQAMGR